MLEPAREKRSVSDLMYQGRHLFLMQFILFTSLICVLWIFVAIVVKTDQEVTIETERTRVKFYATMYEERIRRIIKQVDQASLFIKLAYESGNIPLPSLLKHPEMLSMDITTSLAVVDTLGNLYQSSSPISRVSVSDRDYFQRSREGFDGLSIDRLRVSRLTGKPSIEISRRLNNPDGTFAGLVVFSIPHREFLRNPVNLSEDESGTFGLLGSDGFARVGHGWMYEEILAGIVPDKAISKDIVSLVHMKEYPLAVYVGVRESDAMHDYERRSDATIWFASLASLGLLVPFGLSFRQTLQTVEHRSQLVKYAYYDVVTGLANRRLGRDRLQHALDRLRRSAATGGECAVIMIDLDNFKFVNDTLGHDCGDLLLKEVALRLTACVRIEDTVCRLGGDEFHIIIEEYGSPFDLVVLCNRIMQAIQAPIHVGGYAEYISASLGIAVAPHDGDNPMVLSKNADVAMYQAKGAGKNQYRFFNQKMVETAVYRAGLQDALHRALINEEFFLTYQPKVRLVDGYTVGFEALIRWRSNGGIIPPLDFIPQAEVSGFITSIGKWVINKACQQIAEWRQAGMRDVVIAVNVSPLQFRDPQLLPTIEKALITHGIPPYMLEVEITESAVLQDKVEALQVLARLATLGVRVALDDFGTGYSSLGTLHMFAVDSLKVDQAFINALDIDARTAQVVQAIVTMSQGLDMQTVAEGISSTEQYAFIKESGCDYGQGYFFSPPMEARLVPEYLGRETTRVEDWQNQYANYKRG